MEKYKVDITLLDISDDEYDKTMFNLVEYLDGEKIEYEIGVGEEM